jgi:hypothetical protein
MELNLDDFNLDNEIIYCNINCKINLIKYIQKIINNNNNQKQDNKSTKNNILLDDCNNNLIVIKEMIENICIHELVEDDIDISPDYSQRIIYCIKCEKTF